VLKSRTENPNFYWKSQMKGKSFEMQVGSINPFDHKNNDHVLKKQAAIIKSAAGVPKLAFSCSG